MSFNMKNEFYTDIDSATGSSCSFVDTNVSVSQHINHEKTKQARLIRQRKNESVRKSRLKSKQNTADTEIHILRLTIDNQELSQHIHGLQYELAMLKTVYQQQSMQENQAYELARYKN